MKMYGKSGANVEMTYLLCDNMFSDKDCFTVLSIFY